MKKFVLPDTWYVKVTKENQNILSEWRFDKSPNYKLSIGSITGMYRWEYHISKEHNLTVNENWENEITYNQFLKYVLKAKGIKYVKPNYSHLIKLLKKLENVY